MLHGWHKKDLSNVYVVVALSHVECSLCNHE